MSQGIIYRLKNYTPLTDEVSADKIRAYINEQTTTKPYIIVGSRLVDPHDNYDTQILDEYETTIIIVADRVETNTAGTIKGADNIGQIVRTALQGITGSYGGQDINRISFQSQDTPIPIPLGNNKREFELEQQYTVKINR